MVLTNVDRLISDSSVQHSRFAFHYCWRFRQATEHVSLFSGNEDTFLIADSMTPDSASADGGEAKTVYKPGPYVESFETLTAVGFRTGTPFILLSRSKMSPRNNFFNMHKKLLCDISGFFRAALNGILQESKNQAIAMAEDDAEVFRYLRYWAYTGDVEQKPRDPTVIPWHTLAGIDVFAEARCMAAL